MENNKYFRNEIEELNIEFNKNFSSTMLAGNDVLIKIIARLEEFRKEYEGDEDESYANLYFANRFKELVRRNNNLTSELEALKGEYEGKIEKNYEAYNIEKDVKDKSIWDLAIRLSYEEYCGNSSAVDYNEWKSSCNAQANKDCRRVYIHLCRIHDNILPIYLNAIGVSDYTSIRYTYEKDRGGCEKCNRVKEADRVEVEENETADNSKITEEDNDKMYVKPDMLFLLSCLYSFMDSNRKKWKSKEFEGIGGDANYGRSFLRNGNGIMRYMLKNALARRFARILYLDVIGKMMQSALIVFSRNLYQELFWDRTRYFEEICNPFYAKTVRFVMSDSIKKGMKKDTVVYAEKEQIRSVKDYINTKYSMVDELYWIL
ncbi:hypothetical protein [Selenomonas sp. KH1T6]|uniref:hypothetical protein n=1 Tax=Selenomonas sp. KH1T6 TaxID=3158784 RepID=UPI0015870652